MADNFDKAVDLAARLRESADSKDNEGAEGLIRVAKEAAEMLENQAYIILGVMHSVDKWLDGKELEQDEVNRAATMREKISISEDAIITAASPFMILEINS